MTGVAPVTDVIDRGNSGAAARELLPLIYTELRRLAAHKMAGHRADHTLEPAELVHEAWLRLRGHENTRLQDCGHLFAAAAEAMRHILIDSARRKRAVRHGGDLLRVEFQDAEVGKVAAEEDPLAIHEAVDKLAAEDFNKAEVVRLRYFAGMTFEEAAEVMGISVATAKRYWAYARVWLYEEMRANNLQSRPRLAAPAGANEHLKNRGISRSGVCRRRA